MRRDWEKNKAKETIINLQEEAFLLAADDVCVKKSRSCDFSLVETDTKRTLAREKRDETEKKTHRRDGFHGHRGKHLLLLRKCACFQKKL